MSSIHAIGLIKCKPIILSEQDVFYWLSITKRDVHLSGICYQNFTYIEVKYCTEGHTDQHFEDLYVHNDPFHEPPFHGSNSDISYLDGV